MRCATVSTNGTKEFDPAIPPVRVTFSASWELETWWLTCVVHSFVAVSTIIPKGLRPMYSTRERLLNVNHIGHGPRRRIDLIVRILSQAIDLKNGL